MEFICGGMAAVGAAFFTNPLEVLKTRMQLQGELAARGHHAVYYRTVLHAGYMIVKHEGLLALQKGLVPALLSQFIMHGIRLGIIDKAVAKGYETDANGNIIFYKCALIGGVAGVIGQYLANPLFLVKTQIQAQSAAAISVGHQHKFHGTLNALVIIYSRYGIKGWFRGGVASIPRAFVGCATQITSFDYAKRYIKKFEFFHDKPISTSFWGSMVGGVVCSVMANPFDLVLTRLFNQPIDANGKGKMYNNYMDCVVKIYQMEGIFAFYKGIWPMYLRLGPHTVLTLVFWDELKTIFEEGSHRLD